MIRGRTIHHPHGMMRRFQLDGTIVQSQEEATQLGLLYGILHYYGRNTIKFVMSRAARKRGKKTTDRSYLWRKEMADVRRRT